MSNEKHSPSSFRPFAKHVERAFLSIQTPLDPSTALVVLDANVLLAPYRTSAAALDEIKRIYAKLKREGRLLVPAQAAREFAKNRPNLVAALHKLVRDARSLGINGRYDAPPAVVDTPEHKRAAEALAQIQTALRSYREALNGLADKIAGWQRADPILDVYGELFDSATVRELSLTSEVVEEIRKGRYEAKVPPGYKDKGKDDGGGGDLIIWLTILESAASAGRDTIFVTEETKEDWFHRADGEPVFLRYELAEEYAAATSGRTLTHMTLSNLLAAFGAKETVVREVKEEERVPWWKQFAESSIEEQVLARLGEVVGSDATVSKQQHAFPDIILDLDAERIGVEVTTARDTSYGRISELLWQALGLFRSGEFAEIAVVFVAPDERVARRLEDWFAEERYLGPGVSAIVVQPAAGGLRVLVNQATHAVLKRAFPRT